MGVTKLWSLLSKACDENRDLSSLHGQRVAVDLSSWICELKKIPIAQKIPNLHLKNLYHRTACLLKHGIKLVFVEDGAAPEIKKAALLKRNNGIERSLDRIGLKKISEECRQLLTHLGLPCLQSEGEAEALCALLNHAGIVDAVLTSDGDAFLYGAKKVYRNLKIETGTVDYCDMDTINEKLQLERRGLITMALLSGCDYGQEGVFGIGIQKGYEFIQLCNKLNVDPLTRIMSWRQNKELKNLQTIKDSPLKKPSHCTMCKHLGTKPDHFRNGCKPCDMEQSCDPDSSVACDCDSCIVEINKFELNMREKAIKDPDFPDQKVIDEFLDNLQGSSLPGLAWSPIDVPRLKVFMQSYTSWNEVEFFNKISDLLVNLQINEMEFAVSDKLQAQRIVRRSIHKKLPSVVVEWEKLAIDTVTKDHHVVTVSEEKFTKLYPQMMEEFNKSKEKEKQEKDDERKRKAKQRYKEKKEMKGQTTITDCFAVTKKAKRSPSPPLKHTASETSEEDSEPKCITLE